MKHPSPRKAQAIGRQTWLLLVLSIGCIGLASPPAPAAEGVVVPPGAALDAPMVEDLLRRSVPPPSDGEWAMQITEPLLPLANPTDAPLSLEMFVGDPAGLDPDSASAHVGGWLQVTETSGHSARVPFAAELRSMVPILVPLRTIAAGSVLDRALLTEVAWPKARLDADAVRDLDELGPVEAASRLAAGRPVARSSLRSPRLVHQGEAVMITFQRGSLRLTMSGRALEDAGLHDLIRIANPVSGRQIQGQVVAAGEVLVGPSQ